MNFSLTNLWISWTLAKKLPFTISSAACPAPLYGILGKRDFASSTGLTFFVGPRLALK